MKMTVMVPEKAVELVNSLFTDKQINITDWDGRRVYIDCDGDEYTVRCWNVCEHGIEWTLYRTVENDDGTSHGENVAAGFYEF